MIFSSFLYKIEAGAHASIMTLNRLKVIKRWLIYENGLLMDKRDLFSSSSLSLDRFFFFFFMCSFLKIHQRDSINETVGKKRILISGGAGILVYF